MTWMDRRTYLDIVGTLPTGVTVVTTLDHAGRPHGMTVSAVCSVSADPPILLICIDRRSRTLRLIRDAGSFAVNFLRGDRAAIGQRFGSPDPDRFSGVNWQPASANGVPVLVDDALSHAACRTLQEIEAGDHLILIGLVESGSPPPPLSRPLTYFRRQYGPWAGEVRFPGASDTRLALECEPMSECPSGRGGLHSDAAAQALRNNP
jgi:3-hydroxy-9,10-secoandrosta-1,3,5(10)-triene-9,17-dione monooxygenase reductase component